MSDQPTFQYCAMCKPHVNRDARLYQEEIAELKEELEAADRVLHWRHDDQWQSCKKIRELETVVESLTAERDHMLKTWMPGNSCQEHKRTVEHE